jgi:subtilisin family serine protease
MAGSIGARHDIRGVAGIAPYCKIIPIKLDALGHADQGFCDVQAAEGVFKARALGAKVINMSFGFPQGGCGFDSTTSSLRDAIEFAAESALCVTGMGNFNSDYPLFPAAWDSVIAVGGTKPGGLRWKPHPTTPPCTSPPGPEQSFYCDCYVYGSNYGNHIDVVAPARMVMTTWLIDSAAYTDKFCGTSHSAAIVSAIAGLIYSQDLLLGIGLSPFQVKEVIEKSADDTAFCGYCDPENPVGWDQYHGWGKVNAYHALVAISRGDANNDKTINQQDVDYLISYWLGGPPPVPHKGLADVDCSGAFSMVDIIYLNNFVNNGGPRPLICYKFNYP